MDSVLIFANEVFVSGFSPIDKAEPPPAYAKMRFFFRVEIN